PLAVMIRSTVNNGTFSLRATPTIMRSCISVIVESLSKSKTSSALKDVNTNLIALFELFIRVNKVYWFSGFHIGVVKLGYSNRRDVNYGFPNVGSVEDPACIPPKFPRIGKVPQQGMSVGNEFIH
ncbi:MAG: hypothetical protein M3Q26_04830, partial [Acidobacteriota bacterium]|nr:hypothetical protein [Acidobacteriota bacterium]